MTDPEAVSLADSELQSLTNFACQLADLAGNTIMPYFRQELSVDNKLSGGSFDPVTVADKEAELRMREQIQSSHPGHGILGEEYGAVQGETGLTWVLDPIDGTRAFISGLPVWGTLIALHDGQRPVIGVMDQPFTGERFIASGNRSVLQQHGREKILQTRACNKLDQAIMMSTDPDMFDRSERRVQQQLASSVKLMRFGGDCYAYCMLASGCIDLVVEAGLSAYDIQALIPIIECAGGVVSDWQGNPADSGGQVVAASNLKLHAQALELLAPAAKKSASIL